MFNNGENTRNQQKTPKIHELYPDFTPEEQAEAEDTFRRYMELVWRIHQRLQVEENEKIDEKPFKR